MESESAGFLCCLIVSIPWAFKHVVFILFNFYLIYQHHWEPAS